MNLEEPEMFIGKGFKNIKVIRKRLKALEDHVSMTGEVVTEPQLKSLERAKKEKISWGEIET